MSLISPIGPASQEEKPYWTKGRLAYGKYFLVCRLVS